MLVLNMIVRNAETTIIAALDSVQAAVDFYVIGFAGESDDSTRQLVTDWLDANAPARFVVLDFDFVDFADARNKVLAATPDEFKDDPNSFMLWMDSDDTILGVEGIRDLVASLPAEVGSIQFPYVYQRDENGNIMVVHDRERIVRLNLEWQWARPVHEALRTTLPHQIVRSDVATWLHNWEVSKSTRTDRNMAILLQELVDHPNEKRTKIYIAHSYYSNENFEEARRWFVEYYGDPENELEQWQAATFAGDCSLALKEWEEAIGWYLQAVETRPEIIDPYLGLASAYSRMGDWQKSQYWFDQADANKSLPPSILFVLPGRYTFNRWAYEHYTKAGNGDVVGARNICIEALKYTKNRHDGFLYFWHLYTEMLDRQKSLDAAKHLVYHLQKRGDALAASEILRFMPRPLEESEEFEALRRYAYEGIEHLFNPAVDIYSGGSEIAGASAGEFDRYPEKMERVQAVFDILDRRRSEKIAAENKTLTVLDLGCGDGAVACRLAEFGYLVTGIDTSERNIERAKERAEQMGITDRVRFICGDARSADQQDIGAHDVALILEVVEHVLDPAILVSAAAELADVVIITTPHQEVGDEIRNTPDGKHMHHVREFDFGMMVRMAAGLGLGMNTLDTAYSMDTMMPGYGSWVFELVKDVPAKMPVVFYVGQSAEKWNPTQIDKGGIGGSETAVVEMAKRFRQAGHPTFVYGPVDGVWDGVFYRQWKHFDPSGPAGGAGALLFISSRIPELFDTPVNAAVRWLWCHDNSFKWGNQERLTPERAAQINAVLVLSEWQKEKFAVDYPFIADKLLVTANGINPERFADLDFSEREPHRFIWSSSFDRGLERVLAMWPSIREKYDDAELHVYYGFDTADKIYGVSNPTYNNFRARVTDGLAQDGIVYHGRTSQKEMAAEFAKASFWLYPTDFAETYCITALEVQACGVYPVTSNVGALPERMKAWWPTMDKDASDDEYLQRVAALLDLEGEIEREALISHALSKTWDKVFVQWKKSIDGFVKENMRLRRAEIAVQEKEDGNSSSNP